jgi:hypothetical protein
MSFIFQHQIRQFLAREGEFLTEHPSPGLFYVVPILIRSKGMWRTMWVVNSSPSEIYRVCSWKRHWDGYIAPSLASCWEGKTGEKAETLTARLRGLDRALPRGRVRQSRTGKWEIRWGGDFPIPGGLVLNTVLQDFCLLNFDYEVIATAEESCMFEAKERLRQTLGLRQDWSGIAEGAERGKDQWASKQQRQK